MLNNYIERYIQNYKRDIRNGKIPDWQVKKIEIINSRGESFLKAIKERWKDIK